MTDFLNCKTVHFVGIGGIGVSAIARFFAAKGAKVSGSDRAAFDGAKKLHERGIKIFTKHSAKNLPKDAEAVVYSSAVPAENPELSLAGECGIPCFEYAEALGEIMKGKYGIGVSGTNGKTTTTAMLGKILEEAKMDPMVIVGGRVPGWDGNLRLPRVAGAKQGLPNGNRKNIFVAEACEYRRHFLKLAPKAVVLTNIEAEHLDYYKDLADIKNAFAEYVGKLPRGGFLVYNADDKNCAEVSKKTTAKKISCSLGRKADAVAKNIRYEKGKQVFEITWRRKEIGTFSVGVPGRFNVMNALQAAAAAMALGASAEAVRKTLRKFFGTWRRFEKVGKAGKTIVVSDYAHHPSGVGATIQAAQELYPKKKILFVFQPHQKDRTLKLLHEFAHEIGKAENALIAEIYEVAGRNEAQKEISSRDLVNLIQKNSKTQAVYAPSLFAAKKMVKKVLPRYDVLVVMGAGDIYKIGQALVSGKKHEIS